ncbi:MAG TPA: UDP-3-O-(3-hydroxymyristoyl)glucosamine N-acyltransferase [Allosphingosinicella sp.]|nr:UDP-3-O-(3-hydroxymyristoyl)glucosamine N-acyltransferase [Allosphingosinicella sp.]
MKARDLMDRSAGILGLSGDGDVEITHVSALAGVREGALTFLKAGSVEEIPQALRGSGFGGALICRPAVAAGLASGGQALLISDHPRLSFMRLSARYFPPPSPPPGVHPTAHVDPSSRVDPSASVGAFCYVGANCSIGARTVVHPHVTLYQQVIVGADVTIHAGTAIGADGFGYERGEDGALEKFPHIGGVVIEDGVEIGSNTSIDRGSLENTILRRGCKIDNQVHIAHNVEIGENAVVIAQSMIGGSVRIGARAWLAPAAVVMNQVSIGADALIGLGAVVTKNVADGAVMMGAPAVPEREFKANRAALKSLLDGR